MCDLRNSLTERLHIRDIKFLCMEVCAPGNEGLCAHLLELISAPNDRVAYNALWILTHFSAAHRVRLIPYRNRFIDILLATKHDGKRRLLLNLLEAMPCDIEDIRTDYLEFCMSNIISQAPYAVRAFCIKQAFAQCRHYPELIDELYDTLQLLRQSELSPGLKSVVKHTLKKIACERGSYSNNA